MAVFMQTEVKDVPVLTPLGSSDLGRTLNYGIVSIGLENHWIGLRGWR